MDFSIRSTVDISMFVFCHVHILLALIIVGGGMPQSTNRSLWPVSGGAVAFQPGWFQGHSKALIYVNIGIDPPGGVGPPNMSHPVVPPFEIVGPDNEAYNGTICLPQVPLPTNVTFNIGDNVTIQVIETAQHGAAIYNCADVTLADPADVPMVNETNCFNSSDMDFALVFTTASLSGATTSAHLPSALVVFIMTVAAFFAFGV
ncbi:hypothetical protein AAFC00_004520 [Neodothiora populina]|uniref:Copper acquisition factor BIM1-like domain-containing protein n=1 Tax=Neodothiora populina TaxID=2781224 RepID=A0ABR3P2A4_9PEZI